MSTSSRLGIMFALFRLGRILWKWMFLRTRHQMDHIECCKARTVASDAKSIRYQFYGLQKQRKLLFIRNQSNKALSDHVLQ